MRVEYAILADGVGRREDGKLDIFGAGVDRITAASVPARHAMFTLVIRLALTRGEFARTHKLAAAIRSTSGNEIAAMDGSLTPAPLDARENIERGKTGGAVILLQFPGVVFPEYGPYELSWTWDGELVGEPITLAVVEPPSDDPPGS